MYYILKFDIVPLNSRYGYNPFGGILIAPITGTYMFTWSFMSGVDGYVFSDLTKNTDVIGNRFADSLNSTVYNFSTGIVVAYVNQGDNEYVRMVGFCAINLIDTQNIIIVSLNKKTFHVCT